MVWLYSVIGGGVLIGLLATVPKSCGQGEKQLGKALEYSYKDSKKDSEMAKKLGECEKERKANYLKTQLKHDREMRKMDIDKYKKANDELYKEAMECIGEYKKLKNQCQKDK